jgi:hypothetical protein
MSWADITLSDAIFAFFVDSRFTRCRRIVYSLTNTATIRARVTQLGPTYRRPSAIQRGWLVTAGMHVDF